MSPDEIETFIPAPNFPPSSQAAAGGNRLRHYYSLIGLLISSAQVSRHLLGFYREDWQVMTAEVVQKLGFARAMVVHGLDSIDEISLLGRNPRLFRDIDATKKKTFNLTSS